MSAHRHHLVTFATAVAVLACAWAGGAVAPPAHAVDPGETLWTRVWTDPSSNLYGMVERCPGGDVVVLGGRGDSLTQIVVARYSAAGKLRWRRFVATSGTTSDETRGFAVDRFGNTIVAGVRDPGGDADILVVKIGPTGVVKWTKTYDGGADGWDGADSVVTDRDGYILVACNVVTPAGEGAQIMKLRPGNGSLVWTRSYTAAHELHTVGDIAIAPSGAVYATGETRVAAAGRLIVVKLTGTGTIVWTREVPGISPADTGGTRLAIGPSGTVHVLGYATTAIDQATLLLVKYSPAGVEKWRDGFDVSAVDSYDQSIGFAVDGDGNAFASGYSGVPANAPSHAFLVRWSPAGTRTMFVSPANDTASTSFYDVVPDGAGGCYVAGTFTGNSMSSPAEMYSVGYLARYSTTCTARWERYYTLFRRKVAFQSLALCPGTGLCVAGYVTSATMDEADGFVQMRRR